MSLERSDLAAARDRISGVLEATPCLPARQLSQRCGCSLYLKCESLQETGSFKTRGALNRLIRLEAENPSAGVVAASAGNHAQGIAYAARHVGMAATIVMPEDTPRVKIARTRDLGAEVLRAGLSFHDAYQRALELATERDLEFVSAFDDLDVMAGQGTVGLEIHDQVPNADVVVVPIGGGGLIAGLATALAHANPTARIVGVQTASAPSMHSSLEAGSIQPVTCAPTLAEGIAIKHPGRLTFPILQELVSEVVLVTEAEIEEAIYSLLASAKLLAEGAGAATLAALLAGRVAGLEPDSRVVAVVSGGNIDPNVLQRIVERALVREARLVRLRVTIGDRPGALAGLLARIGELEANVMSVHHERSFSLESVWQVEAELTLGTKNRRHVEEILSALRESGYQADEEPARPLGRTSTP